MDRSYSVRKMRSAGRRSRMGRMRVHVCPTTGGRLELVVYENETVHGLKCTISRKLRIPTEKISLLYKDRILRSGKLQDNKISDDSRITLLPNMESGMSFQKPDVEVIQALENLSDAQVHNFLSGRAPLLLAMRLGDHMMFVQLQLSTSPCGARRPQASAIPMMSAPPMQTAGKPCYQERPNVAPNPSGAVTLADAGRSLSHKLSELSRITSPRSARVPDGKCSPPTVDPSQPPATSTPPDAMPASLFPVAPPGAIIESMQHVGQGVYSGTFSGTLDPSLQGTDGKPRRDISTIVHILNDLLGSSPNNKGQHLLKHVDTRHTQHQQTREGQEMKQSNANQEESALRGKVQQLQLMMEERRQRRQARRETRAPYKWCSNGKWQKNLPHCDVQQEYRSVERVEATATAQESVKMTTDGVSENNYANTNLEQETVAV